MLNLADLPELTVKDLARVASAVNASSADLIWRGTTQNGVPGHPIVVSSALFGQLMQITGDTGGSEVMKANRKRTNFVALPGNRALCDLDTPEDWATWRSAKS